MVESSADAIIGKTLDGVVTSWNSAAETLFGYTADEIVGRNVAQIVPPEPRRGGVVDPARASPTASTSSNWRRRRIRKDGSVVEVSMTVSPIRDAGGTVVGLATVSRDITERNRAEAERRILADRLGQSERLESVGQLAGGIAHDFNNLLAVIMNYASFVSSQTEDRPAVQADVEQIQFAAERAARLTRQLLTFARRDTIKTESLDLNAIVADVHNLLSRTIGEHIDLVVDPAEWPADDPRRPRPDRTGAAQSRRQRSRRDAGWRHAHDRDQSRRARRGLRTAAPRRSHPASTCNSRSATPARE